VKDEAERRRQSGGVALVAADPRQPRRRPPCGATRGPVDPGARKHRHPRLATCMPDRRAQAGWSSILGCSFDDDEDW